MNIWKIASRWSDNGNASSSILEVFFDNNIAFAGREQGYIQAHVKVDDLVALADGLKIIAIGKVTELPKPVTQFEISLEQKSKFDYEDKVIGFKVNEWIKLESNDIFDYRMGTFHKAGFIYGEKIKSLFEKYTQRDSQADFEINAKTCTLIGNKSSNALAIFNKDINYVIPIYQRPYSWKEEQVEKFIYDIFVSFWGNEKNKKAEAMFIGTMQLSIPDSSNKQNIIDGQQRLTTLFILLKVLKLRNPLNETLKSLFLDCLSTNVSQPIQQKYWVEFLNCTTINDEESLNPYLINAKIIQQELNQNVNSEENLAVFSETLFIQHLVSNVYFVVIETKAGLTKTLEIFNAINTTGLDLNAGDLFKIRLYEYLTEKEGQENSVFEEINALYYSIDEKNKEFNRTVTDMQGILRIYQYILIAKHDLNKELFSYSVNAFFEQLFDSLIGNNANEHFKSNQRLLNPISDLNRIISLRFDWENGIYSTPEDACAVKFIAWSRYSRFSILSHIFLFRFKDDVDCWVKLEKFNRLLSKLYIIYSVRFEKAINGINNFSYDLLKTLIDSSKSYEEVIKLIGNQIGTVEGNSNLNHFLTENLTENAKRKNIVCRLSAMLDEEYNSKEYSKIHEIRKKLFETAIDIEHIQAYNDLDKEQRTVIWNEWKGDINSIGNLIVLEQHINRSISNKDYNHKVIQYKNSVFETVKVQLDHSKWDLEKCKIRKEKELKKLLNYLFNNN